MNKYQCLYQGEWLLVEAETSFSAQTKAAKEFKAKKRYQVTPILVEKDGQPISIDSASI